MDLFGIKSKKKRIFYDFGLKKMPIVTCGNLDVPSLTSIENSTLWGTLRLGV